MKRELISISLPAIDEREWRALKDPVTNGWVTQGPRVAEFEKLFAKFHGVKHATAVTSCTTGLHLALKALKIGPGDEVIVPSFTWIATANAVLYCGATPVLIDIDPQTYNMDLSQLALKITKRTKAVIQVHLFGLCVDIDLLREFLPENIFIIEDAACAVGSRVKGKFAGSLGDIAVFSFHPRKIITTGEGGMITTNDDHLADIMNMMRNHGASVSEEQRHYGPQPYILPEFSLLGYNYRMTDLQGAMGLVQLKKLSELIKERQQRALFYNEQLAEISWLSTPAVPAGHEHSWQSYVCYIDEKTAPMPRNDIMKYLQERGIATRPGTHAVHMLALYKKMFGYKEDDFPVARDCNNFSMAIPLHNRMTDDDYNFVAQEIRGLDK